MEHLYYERVSKRWNKKKFLQYSRKMFEKLIKKTEEIFPQIKNTNKKSHFFSFFRNTNERDLSIPSILLIKTRRFREKRV